ncbi:hypothetical protein [Aestuariicoccus sp. MJ-SS9]|uniref:hypothetical protein n=1 Tax=Aestuariicoccus sp. MJ-SS9 TaxID=3079855 RepID=UPI0029155E81|nr:hypothetical protein [Aestuariicoccus sp. MJ-SS9]MDU8912959.1 hypothetical protein [Aestuariicoccus sp. MJ-SS9]
MSKDYRLRGKASELLMSDKISEVPPGIADIVRPHRQLGALAERVIAKHLPGELPVIRDGRMIRVHPMDLDRYIKQRRGM